MGRRQLRFDAGFTHPFSMDLRGSLEEMTNSTNNTIGIANLWSISIWFKSADPGASIASLFTLKNTGNANDQIFLGTDSADDDYIISLRDSGGTRFKVYHYTSSLINWNHFVHTWDGTDLRTWNNGVEVILSGFPAKEVDDPGTMSTTTRRVSFCGDLASLSTKGNFIVHSAALWDVALTQAEITALYNNGIGHRFHVPSVQPSALKHWWLLGTPGNIGFDNVASGSIDVNTNSVNVTEADDQIADVP